MTKEAKQMMTIMCDIEGSGSSKKGWIHCRWNCSCSSVHIVGLVILILMMILVEAITLMIEQYCTLIHTGFTFHVHHCTFGVLTFASWWSMISLEDIYHWTYQGLGRTRKGRATFLWRTLLATGFRLEFTQMQKVFQWIQTMKCSWNIKHGHGIWKQGHLDLDQNCLLHLVSCLTRCICFVKCLCFFTFIFVLLRQ